MHPKQFPSQMKLIQRFIHFTFIFNLSFFEFEKKAEMFRFLKDLICISLICL